jgi:hypothetical protein
MISPNYFAGPTVVVVHVWLFNSFKWKDKHRQKQENKSVPVDPNIVLEDLKANFFILFRPIIY